MILDTNIVSEVMAAAPSQAVIGWLNAQDTASLYLTTITIAEIDFGLQLLPQGKRRRVLEDRFEQFLTRAFAQRILDFDQSAARHYGPLMAHRREIGLPMAALDGQIAAIARARGLAVATRNTRDFAQSGIEVVNPFE